MAGQFEPAGVPTTDTAAPSAPEAADMIAQMRQLAAHDPAAAERLVADVLAELDRVTGGTVCEQLPDGAPFGGEVGEPRVAVDLST